MTTLPIPDPIRRSLRSSDLVLHFRSRVPTSSSSEMETPASRRPWRVEVRLPGESSLVRGEFDPDAPVQLGKETISLRTLATRMRDPKCPLHPDLLGTSLAAQLLEALPPASRKPFAECFDRTARITRPRVILLGAPSCELLAFPWETLRFEGERSVIANHVELLRLIVPARPSAAIPRVFDRGSRLRLLLVHGAITQDPSKEGVSGQAGENEDSFGALLERSGIEFSTAATGEFPDPASSHHLFHTTADLLRILCADGGYDIVHFSGHSDAKADLATKLKLGPKEEQHLRLEDLGRALAQTRTKVLVLQSCATGNPVAMDELLEGPEHVVALAALADPWSFPEGTRAFYSELARGGPISAAVVAMRRATTSIKDRWIPQHWTRTLEDDVFVDEDAWAFHVYRQRILHQFRKMTGPIFEHLGTDTLVKMYVQMDVRVNERGSPHLREEGGLSTDPHARSDRPAFEEMRGSPAPRTLAELLDRHESGQPHYLLVGPLGAGKTTELRKLTLDLAQDSRRFPFYFHLARWPRRGGRLERFEKLLEEDGLLSTFRRFDSAGRAVLFLDALDEVGDIVAVSDLLHEIAVTVRSPVVVATRRLGLRRDLVPSSFQFLDLLELGELGADESARRQELLRKVLSTLDPSLGVKDLAELVERIESEVTRPVGGSLPDGQVRSLSREFATTPFFVYLLGLVALRRHRVRGQGHGTALPAHRHSLFAEAITCMLEGSHHSPATPIEDTDAVRGILAGLAYRWTVNDDPHSTTTRGAIAILGEITEAPPRVSSRKRPGSVGTHSRAKRKKGAGVRKGLAFLQRVSRRTALLVERRDQDALRTESRWEFPSKGFRDALAAEWLYTATYEPARKNENQTQAIRAVLSALETEISDVSNFLARWGEALGFLTARIAEDGGADEWLLALTTKEGLGLTVAFHCLVFAPALQNAEQTLKALLETSTSSGKDIDADDLDRIYRALVMDVDDTEIALGHLRTLGSWIARSTHDLDRAQKLHPLFELLDGITGRTPHEPAPSRERANASIVAKAEEVAVQVASASLARGVAPEARAKETAELFAEVPGQPDEPLWSLIPPGWYRRGSEEGDPGSQQIERPAHPIHISRPFWIARVPVTFAQYRAFEVGKAVEEHEQFLPRRADIDLRNLPMTCVTWFEAELFCRALTARLRTLPEETLEAWLLNDSFLPEGSAAARAGIREGWGGKLSRHLVARLPTEAEWEYCARAVRLESLEAVQNCLHDREAWPRFWCGEELTRDVGVVQETRDFEAVHPVAKGRRANAFGLFDVHGNVGEWCQDWFAAYGELAETGVAESGDSLGVFDPLDPRGPSSGAWRVLRGGSLGVPALRARSAERGIVHPALGGDIFGDFYFGFRVVLSVSPAAR